MNRAQRTALAVVVTTVAMVAGFLIGRGSRPDPAPASTSAASGDAGTAAKTGERKVLYYRNPMGLPDTSPVPKKDPMGMDYIPVYEGEDQSGSVKVSADRIQSLGVRTEQVVLRPLRREVRAVGTIEVDERGQYTVAPKFEGWIEKLYVNTSGQGVARGQALADVYSPELVSAQREYLIAYRSVSTLSGAGADAQQGVHQLADAALERLRNWDISEEQIARLRQTGEPRRTLTLVAPAGGYIVKNPPVAGMRFMPGEPLFQIANLGTVWLIADVFEQDLALVKRGAQATLHVDAYPTRAFPGHVTFIYPALNSETRTARVRVELVNSDGLLKPGMYGTVQIDAGSKSEVLMVPDSAVIDSGTRQVVLVSLGEGRFEPRNVKLGARGGGFVEVLSGVSVGELVVTRANFLIDSESNLKAALGGFDADKNTLAAGGVATAAGEGSVVEVDVGANRLRLDHDPIPALKWPRMEMEFAVTPGALPKSLKPGERVKFELQSGKPGEFVINRLEIVSPEQQLRAPLRRRRRRSPTPISIEDAMLARLIDWSLRNVFLVLLATAFAIAAGVYALLKTPVDAIPDLSDVQIIVFTEFPGQAPQVVEDQVTYPLTTAMLGVPRSKVVRGFSFFGASFVYVIFDDGTDLYWARSRVLEYLSGAAARLPAGVSPTLGPDATGVGWVYQYVVTGANRSLAELRTLQDWFIRYQLWKAPGVSEIASIGGFVQQYVVTVDPHKLHAYGIPLSRIIETIRMSNRDVGGRIVELSETEYMVRGIGYLRGAEDIERLTVRAERGVPVRLSELARVELAPDERRGIAELNGQGEVVGGIVVARYGTHVIDVIENVKARIREIASGLPEGVRIEAVYDRSGLIERAIDTLKRTLLEEALIVAAVCLIFLMHARSALVAILMLPVGILIAFVAMHALGINANIMSLGGIAIAIGAMIDAAIVMIENAHKHLERAPPDAPRLALIYAACVEVGPALFFSLLIITVSFLPVFTLEAQEGRLFAPLAYTKTFAMAAAALLSVTLVPVLMLLFIRGKVMAEKRNPINRGLIRLYRPIIHLVLHHRVATIVVALAVTAFTWLPASRLGSEFMPTLNEGTLFFMPTGLPGMSVTKAAELLQTQDRTIKSFPEVESVFGKAGRAITATDPAPVEMFETVINLKPEAQWRPGMTIDKLIAEMDRALQFPGIANSWTMPIRARIDMLSTGIRTPVGIKVYGRDLGEIERLAREIEVAVKTVPGTTSAFAERLTGGFYLNIEPDYEKLSRYGIRVGDVQEVIASALGGEMITTTVEGRERFGVAVRYPRDFRSDPQAIATQVLVQAEREAGQADGDGSAWPAGEGESVEGRAGDPHRERAARRLHLRRPARP